MSMDRPPQSRPPQEGEPGERSERGERPERVLSFGAALRFYRKEAGYVTQEQFAEALGLTQATVSNWERAAEAPRDTYLLTQMADLLGVEADDLRAGRIRRPEAVTVEPRIGGASLADTIRRLRPDATAEEQEEIARFVAEAATYELSEIRFLRGVVELRRQTLPEGSEEGGQERGARKRRPFRTPEEEWHGERAAEDFLRVHGG